MVKPVLLVPDADLLVIEISKVEIESRDISPTLAILKALLEPQNAQRFYEKLELCVGGYDADPRELCEIPEVRESMYRLDQEFPYWLYFINKLSLSLQFITFSICEIHEEDDGGISLNPRSLHDFLARRFAAVNVLLEQGLLNEIENERLSTKVMAYYMGEPD